MDIKFDSEKIRMYPSSNRSQDILSTINTEQNIVTTHKSLANDSYVVNTINNAPIIGSVSNEILNITLPAGLYCIQGYLIKLEENKTISDITGLTEAKEPVTLSFDIITPSGNDLVKGIDLSYANVSDDASANPEFSGLSITIGGTTGLKLGYANKTTFVPNPQLFTRLSAEKIGASGVTIADDSGIQTNIDTTVDNLIKNIYIDGGIIE